MKNLFTEHKTLTCIILVLFIFSLLCQIIIGFLYQNMIKETYNMSSTKNKLLKTCKLKFTNRYELHEGVANITVFVDKFLHGMKLGPIPVKCLQHLGGQLLLSAVFAAGIGACRAIAAEETIGNILAYYFLAFLMLYVYFSITSAVDIKGKQEILKTNLMDYLENNISVRIPQSKKEQERLDGLEAAAMRQKGEDINGEKWGKAGKISAGIMEFSAHKKQEADRKQRIDKKSGMHKKHGMDKRLDEEEAMELEGLLREFVSGT